MRIKMSPLGTKGSILLGDIRDTADCGAVVVPPGCRARPAGEGAGHFSTNSCQSLVEGCLRGRGPPVPRWTHLHGQRPAQESWVYSLQLPVWGVNAGKTLQAPRHLPRLTTPSHPQVKMASWSREKPGNWYSTFRRGKKVSCWKLR